MPPWSGASWTQSSMTSTRPTPRTACQNVARRSGSAASMTTAPQPPPPLRSLAPAPLHRSSCSASSSIAAPSNTSSSQSAKRCARNDGAPISQSSPAPSAVLNATRVACSPSNATSSADCPGYAPVASGSATSTGTWTSAATGATSHEASRVSTCARVAPGHCSVSLATVNASGDRRRQWRREPS